jgi:signal transduction histidine kinase/DNA-binding response OmpR family regulator
LEGTIYRRLAGFSKSALSLFTGMIWVIVIFLFFAKPAPAKTAYNVDSLKSKLAATTDENIKVDILVKITDCYILTDSALAIQYYKQCRALAKKTGYTKGKAKAEYEMFKILKNGNKPDQALASIRLAKSLFLQSNDKLSYADCLVDEGTLLVKQKDMKNAILVLFEAQHIYESSGTNGKNSLALLYSSLGSLHHAQGNETTALDYHHKSLALNKANNFELGISVNYVNIGIIYNALKNYKAATEFYLKALSIKQKLDDRRGIHKCLNNLGVIHMNLGETQKAIEYHEKALGYALGYNGSYDIAMCYINLGYDYQKAKLYKKAISYCLKGIEIAKKSNDLGLIMESSRVLSESYASIREFENAYSYSLQFKQYSDSLTKENNVKEVSEIQARYETVEKDNQIKSLKISTSAQQMQLQRVRVYVVLFIALLVIVSLVVVFLFLQSKSARKVQAKLQEINNLKTAFFANLSHEFRTPLTLMLGPAEKLLETAGPAEKPLLQLIHRNANRLLALDEQLLEFTRIDSGNQKLNLVKGDIVSLVLAIASSFELMAAKKNISFSQHPVPGQIETLFDPDIIEKVVSNLISNAIKYTQAGGSVDLSIYINNVQNQPNEPYKIGNGKKNIRIDVKDNGIGIPSEKQVLIFERFYQLNNYTNGIHEGYGIGLALVRELTILHKGEIALRSSVGDGSLFMVSLPLETSAYTSNELANVKPFKKNTLSLSDNQEFEIIHTELQNIQESGETIETPSHSLLIVEDNPDMRAFLVEILKEGYQISTAPNGSEGLKLATSTLPDLVITDVMMDTMDGIEFCSKLKSNPKTQHIPVIMLTALTALEDRLIGLDQGADDYIEKPFNSKELTARVKNLIAQRKFLKDLFTKELKLEPKSISITSSDALFIQKLIAAIENNMDNPDRDVEFFAKTLGMSRSQLHRKATAITGQPASNFIRIIRLKRAAQLMDQKSGNISEIMYSVGFNSLSYFSKCFREVYLMTPSEYMGKAG